MQKRTDLAVESYESTNKTEIDGVKVTKDGEVTTVELLNENGAKEIGKPVGVYITFEMKSLISDADIFDNRLEQLSMILNKLLPKTYGTVLVAGIGNLSITADALGPKTNNYIFATRHALPQLKSISGFEQLGSVATITTGVLGETGIESAEIIKGVCNQIKPDCVIAVDALASSSENRLGTTVQLSNTGISPGSGVGNHRNEISMSSLGVPVVSIGIPTVVSTGIINGTGEDTLFVTPREIDRIIEQGAKLIAMSINITVHKNIDVKEILALVS